MSESAGRQGRSTRPAPIDRNVCPHAWCTKSDCKASPPDGLIFEHHVNEPTHLAQARRRSRACVRAKRVGVEAAASSTSTTCTCFHCKNLSASTFGGRPTATALSATGRQQAKARTSTQQQTTMRRLLIAPVFAIGQRGALCSKEHWSIDDVILTMKIDVRIDQSPGRGRQVESSRVAQSMSNDQHQAGQDQAAPLQRAWRGSPLVSHISHRGRKRSSISFSSGAAGQQRYSTGQRRLMTLINRFHNRSFSSAIETPHHRPTGRSRARARVEPAVESTGAATHLACPGTRRAGEVITRDDNQSTDLITDAKMA